MRLTTLGALGVGFVLGARAGRETYEQIHDLALRSAAQLEAFGSQGSWARRVQSVVGSGSSGTESR